MRIRLGDIMVDSTDFAMKHNVREPGTNSNGDEFVQGNCVRLSLPVGWG